MDFAIEIDGNGRPQAQIKPSDPLQEQPDALQNAVLLSIHIRRGAWFFNPEFGSRLHEIVTLTDGDVALARQYAAECLAWIQSIGWVSGINVEAARVSGGRLNLRITLSRTAGRDVSYETFFKVV